MEENKTLVSKREAFLFLIFMFALILCGNLVFKLKLEFLFIILTVTSVTLAKIKGVKWGDIEKAISTKYSDVAPAMLILIAIGTIAGTWIYSGTVPMLIYYGLKWLRPEFIAIFAFFTASLVSLFTGTSWGSVATGWVQCRSATLII